MRWLLSHNDVSREEHDELHDSVEELAGAVAKNVETTALVYDVMEKLVEENRHLRREIRAQGRIIEKLVHEVRVNHQLLADQEQRWQQLDSRLIEQHKQLPSQILEGQKQISHDLEQQFEERNNTLLDEIKKLFSS